MIGEVMRECRNFFPDYPYAGEFSIKENKITSVLVTTWRNGYIAITGSAYHDGVWEVKDGFLVDCDLPDEDFNGCVFTLRPPKDFLNLCTEIAAYQAQRPTQALASETFGSYSHSFISGSQGVLTWAEAFRDRLRPYRRMYTEVSL